jgi:hypothetical protein
MAMLQHSEPTNGNRLSPNGLLRQHTEGFEAGHEVEDWITGGSNRMMIRNDNMRINVALMGKGDLSIKIAEWFYCSKQYNLVGVVPVTPEPRANAS